jgi:signal transduction histidine kinase
LIANAIKISYAETRIRVEVTHNDDEAVMSVIDAAQGIPVEDRNRLFRYLSTMSVQATRGEGSHGLGSAITQSIVERQHSRIWVESELGRGSTSRAALPIATPVRDPR